MPSGKQGKEQSEAKETAVHCVMSANCSNIISFSYEALDLLLLWPLHNVLLTGTRVPHWSKLCKPVFLRRKTSFVLFFFFLKAAIVTWNSNNVLHHVQHISPHPTSSEHSRKGAPRPWWRYALPTISLPAFSSVSGRKLALVGSLPLFKIPSWITSKSHQHSHVLCLEQWKPTNLLYWLSS